VRVTLTSSSMQLAFFDRVELARSDEEDELVPVRWTDNYVSLLPGETRTIEARLALPKKGTPLIARQEGWNVARSIVQVTESP